MTRFFDGMICMGYLVAATFFFRFWRQAEDSLFLVFGAAFVLFAVNQGLLAIEAPVDESTSWIFLFRISGFALLILAILLKNLGRSAPRR